MANWAFATLNIPNAEPDALFGRQADTCRRPRQAAGSRRLGGKVDQAEP
jgi:hypothetical protein